MFWKLERKKWKTIKDDFRRKQKRLPENYQTRFYCKNKCNFKNIFSYSVAIFKHHYAILEKNNKRILERPKGPKELTRKTSIHRPESIFNLG